MTTQCLANTEQITDTMLSTADRPALGHDVYSDSAPKSDEGGGVQTHLLTVALEDYFQVDAFRPYISRDEWYRFDSRVERGTERMLELLDRHQARATFFVTGWIAERRPDVIRRVAASGHEVACSGYSHASIREMTRSAFREDLVRGRAAVEDAAGVAVQGYRVAHGWFRPGDLWALDVLAEEGFVYDSSVLPMLGRYRDEPWRRFIHQQRAAGRTLWECPPSSLEWFGYSIPICGGNYFRQFPQPLIGRAIEMWCKRTQAPLSIYCHTWEFDPEQPRVSAGSLLAHVRHYRNLDQIRHVWTECLTRYRFQSIADYLQLGVAPLTASRVVSATECRERVASEVDPSANSGPHLNRAATAPTPITIVVPCFNEESSLGYLANTLTSVECALNDRYDVQFCFVDDGSSDATESVLHSLFDKWPHARVIRHDVNRGITAAVLTGIRAADTEIVCAIDCDCSYDPHRLCEMIPLLTDDVAMVTASPYHPDGGVRNVAKWRLTLSRGASALYRRVLKHKLYTYTSCFRVYRRSAVLPLAVHESGFLGITEILALLDLGGQHVVEAPAVLNSRVFGRSKMKVAGTILSHLRLLGRMAILRLINCLPRK